MTIFSSELIEPAARRGIIKHKDVMKLILLPKELDGKALRDTTCKSKSQVLYF